MLHKRPPLQRLLLLELSQKCHGASREACARVVAGIDGTETGRSHSPGENAWVKEARPQS
jgi:hypothetical protein